MIKWQHVVMDLISIKIFLVLVRSKMFPLDRYLALLYIANYKHHLWKMIK